jgi:dynactin 1
VDSPTTASQQGATESDAGNGEASEDDFSEHEDAIARPNFAPPTIPSAAATERSMGGRRPSSPTAASIHSQRTIRSSAQTNRYVEELEAKVRLLERKRVEDRELRREIEQTQGDRDKAHGIIERLNNKVRPQQQEIEQLKKMLADYESRFQSVEDLKASHEIELENALLDREMAEETAETLKADLEQVRLRNEELEMELEIMKEENSELSKDMSPEDRSNAGWLQLQKTNERLKEALLNLRDMTQDREAELKERIAAMEEQVKDNDNVKLRLGEIQEKLLRSEADADDLRQQLEVALNAEDMIEKLSEENMALKDRIGELDGIIEDLEDLREVNDELEINHIETEKQLQEEIDFKDSLLVDRERTAREQQAALDEADYNINRFRALVTQMQSDLQDLQASKQISETEAAELSSKSRAMLDLNQKLQSSAAKTQVKTIDLELRKLDAEQAAQHLSIVQLFLPETYQTERDSVLALLRFRRISFKSNLIQTFIKERIASFGTRGQDEDVFAACDALDKLTWIAGIAERLTASISSCSAQAFAEYGGALYELEVVERMLDSYIDSLRRDELREADMAIRLGRSIEVMTHLASLHLHNGLADHADDLTTRTALLQSHLDSSISALTVTRNMVERNLPSSSDDMEYEDESVTDAALILNKLKTVIEYVRSAKVISGKTLRSLTELQSRALTLEESHTQRFETAEQLASAITTYCCQSGAALQQLFGEEGRNDRASPSEVSATLARTASSIFALPSTEAGPLATLNNRLRDLTTVLSDLSNLPTDLDNTVEFERAPAPWLARAEEIKHAKEANVDLEAELARAQEHVRERDGLVRRKEMELNEQTIRIEMLEARLKDASKRSAKLGELERDLRDARNAEAKAKAELARAQQDAQADMNRAREEMARLSEQGASGGKLGGAGNKHVDGDTVGFNARISMERQEYRVAGLQGAVRHLKDENQRLRMPAYGLGLDWIEELPLKKSRRTRAMEAEKTVEYLMKLCAQSPSIDLSKATENKLAWRPAKQTPRWQIEGKKGQWAEYHDRLDDVVSRAEASVRRVRKTESAV